MSTTITPLRLPQRNLTGQRFGRQTAIMPSHKTNGCWYWVCECDCSPGAFRPVQIGSLFSRRSLSCGCIQREAAAAQAKVMGDANRRHGLTATVEHKTWDSMRQRCQNPNSASYARYGGRGISVCHRWERFELFLADIGPRPDGMSIDRIDNDGNYEPGNCRWADKRTQSLNRPQNPRSLGTGQYVSKGG